jgi:bifunctional DNA-binding transcriptional regulator/antitoxin component of YhaV-PrlF toxin-antitoxin module
MTKLGRRAQTVVPAKLRRKHRLKEGDRLVWEETAEGFLVRPRKRMSLDDLTGLIAVGGDAVKDKRRVARGELP